MLPHINNSSFRKTVKGCGGEKKKSGTNVRILKTVCLFSPKPGTLTITTEHDLLKHWRTNHFLSLVFDKCLSLSGSSRVTGSETGNSHYARCNINGEPVLWGQEKAKQKPNLPIKKKIKKRLFKKSLVLVTVIVTVTKKKKDSYHFKASQEEGRRSFPQGVKNSPNKTWLYKVWYK